MIIFYIKYYINWFIWSHFIKKLIAFSENFGKVLGLEDLNIAH